MGTGRLRRDPPPLKLLPPKALEKPTPAPPKAIEQPPPIPLKAAEKTAPEPIHSEPAKPWLPLMLTLLALFASIGANIFLGWIAWGLRRRCQNAA